MAAGLALVIIWVGDISFSQKKNLSKQDCGCVELFLLDAALIQLIELAL